MEAFVLEFKDKVLVLPANKSKADICCGGAALKPDAGTAETER
jgi:hypothetical protein